jgi:hypothetical protein
VLTALQCRNEKNADRLPWSAVLIHSGHMLPYHTMYLSSQISTVDTGCHPLPKPEGPTWLAPQPASPHNSVFRDGQNGSRGLVAREVVAWRVVAGEPSIPEAFAPGTRAHSVTITDTANDACNSPCWPEYVHGSR